MKPGECFLKEFGYERFTFPKKVNATLSFSMDALTF